MVNTNQLAEVVSLNGLQVFKLVSHFGQSAQPRKSYYYENSFIKLFVWVTSQRVRNMRMSSAKLLQVKIIVAVRYLILNISYSTFSQARQMSKALSKLQSVFQMQVPTSLGCRKICVELFVQVIVTYMVLYYTKFNPDSLF